MLKAVRFDEQKHKDILDYIAAYRTSKNKTNEGEAMRYLMQLGLESLNNSPQTTVYSNKHSEESKPSLNIDEIKQQISNDIMSQINSQTFANLNLLIDKLGNMQIQPVQIPTLITETKTESTEPQFTKINTTKPIEIPKDTNPLLANLLANANR